MATKNKSNPLPSTGGQSPKKLLSSMSYVEKARCLHDDRKNYGVVTTSEEFDEMFLFFKKQPLNKDNIFIPRKVQAEYSSLYFLYQAKSVIDLLCGPLEIVYSCYQTDTGEEEAALFTGKDYGGLVFYTEECMKDFAEHVLQQPGLSFTEAIKRFFMSESMGKLVKTGNEWTIVDQDGFCIGEYVSSTIFVCKSFVSKDSYTNPTHDEIRIEITKRMNQM